LVLALVLSLLQTCLFDDMIPAGLVMSRTQLIFFSRF
jgi:hypothetical protein